MQETPPTVYLDSSDYSTLADPRRRTEASDRVRSALLAFARSGVRFVFSATHLSEMAPLRSQFVASASARADLLVSLCQRNTITSFDRLMKLEASRLADFSVPSTQVISDDGTWFPELGRLLGPIQAADSLREEIARAVANRGLTRRGRRQLMQALFKRDGRPRPLLQSWLARSGASTDLTELLTHYPMRPENMRVIWRYVAGQATEDEAETAFLESLRDPSWMMRWFAENHDKLSPVHEWVRSPARNFVKRLQPITQVMREFGKGLPTAQTGLLSEEYWSELESQVLLRVANDMVSRWYPGTAHCDDINRVSERCPGLSTALRAAVGVFRDSIGERPRDLRESDLVDALHAMYAPYVEVFRADRYMTPHIQRAVRRRETRIVPRLEELPEVIELVMRSRVQ